MGMIFYSSEEPNSYIIKSISMYTLEYLIFNYTVFKNNARYSTASTTLWCPYHQDTLYILNVDIAQRQASRATQRRTCSSRLSTSLASSPSVCLSTIRYPRLPVIVEEQRSFSQFDAPPPCVRQWRCSGCAKVGNYTIAWKNRRNITKISHRAWPSLTLPLDSSVMDERLKEIDVRMRGTRLYVRITCYRLSFHLSCCAKERTYSTIIFGLMTFDDHKRNSDSAAREQDLSCDFFTMRKIFFARIRSPVDFLLAPIFLSLILRVTLRKSRVEHETCPRRTRAFYVRRSNIARISIFFFFFGKKRGFYRNDIVLSFCSILLCEVAADNAEKFHMKKLELRTFADARNIHLINNEISSWGLDPISLLGFETECRVKTSIIFATRHGCFCAPILQERTWLRKFVLLETKLMINVSYRLTICGNQYSHIWLYLICYILCSSI